MTSTANNPLQDFVLTPKQQSLLFAALNSQRANNAQANSALSGTPSSFTESPIQQDGLPQESPYLDYDYDYNGADSSFDFSFDDANGAKMIGDLPGTTSEPKSDSGDNEGGDKRSHPDDDEEVNGGAKRRESEDKAAKKPGRKPLTTEPSSKRKAQNRAAQRAFRERKEKHLKDLEEKVQELEKASENANSENKQLRSKVEKMTVELNEYKKRVSLMATSRSGIAPPKPSGHSTVNNLNDLSFQFEFPKFGALPGPPEPKITAAQFAVSSSTAQPQSRSNSSQISPMEKPTNRFSPNSSSSYSQIGLDSKTKEDLANFTAGLFTPPLTNGNLVSASRASVDSHYSMSGANSTSSPSASSNSNVGASSSCGTSPEPITQSPMGFKQVDTLTTIGEEHSGIQNSSQDLGVFAGPDMTDFNWLPQDNFQFDPHIFGDYRDPQENIMSTNLDESFFNDAFDADFTTPYNLPATGAGGFKKNLIAEIDAAKSAENSGATSTQLLTCNKIWEELQNCPKVQNGDFDLDGLCSDLQKKAKCSGSGAVVDEKDFKNVMEKYLGKCTTANGIQAAAAVVQDKA